MSIESLSPEKAWSDGADLWVFSKETSSFLSRADWLLNFQISKSQRHNSLALPLETQKILEQTGLNFENSASENSNVRSSSHSKKNLLLSVQQFVPAKWVLIVESDVQTWTQDLFETWNSLARPKLRIFLPKALDFNTFKNHWKKLAGDETSMTVISTGHLKSLASQAGSSENPKNKSKD